MPRTRTASPPTDGSFDSHPGCTKANPDQCLGGGEQFEHTFTKVGRYPYHSRTEGGPGGRGMAGIVTVVTD